jgi:hypothetical protein
MDFVAILRKQSSPENPFPESVINLIVDRLRIHAGDAWRYDGSAGILEIDQTVLIKKNIYRLAHAILYTKVIITRLAHETGGFAYARTCTSHTKHPSKMHYIHFVYLY